jgi:hypothetical protein
LEGITAKDYLERFPSVAGLANSYAAAPSSGSATAASQGISGPRFMVNGDSGNLFINMAEQPLAEKIAAKADEGHAEAAIADAANVGDPDLKVQAFEYIARTIVRKDKITATSALKKMLAALESIKLDRQPAYYASAAGIFRMMGDTESAKDAVQKGLDIAARLYKQDTDSDDPNMAFEAFWPSMNAYSMLLREATQISEIWAIGLLKQIDNAEVRFAAETAIAGSAREVPESRTTMITQKRSSFKMSLGPESMGNSRD